jgi:predicted secreted protein
MMMLQLTIIYVATGLLKSGETWWSGSALYYALNLDHFYRIPATGFVTLLHHVGLAQLSTHVVHWWEMLFFLAPAGLALQRLERERALGTWPRVPRWRRVLSYALWVLLWAAGAFVVGLAAEHYYQGKYIGLRDDVITNEQARWIVSGLVLLVPLAAVVVYRRLRRRRPAAFRLLLEWGLGKRLWLGLGFTFHLLIEIGMNVGTFVQVMWSTYPAWFRGEEIDAFWRWLPSRPARPGEHGRPLRDAGRGRLRRLLGRARSVGDRLVHRAPAPKLTVLHAPDPASVRRAALLRCWDLCHRLEFVADARAQPGALCVLVSASSRPQTGAEAGAELTRVLPGLWPLAGARRLPAVGRLALRIVDQH